MAEAEGVSAEEFVYHVEGLHYIDLAENEAALGTTQDGELYAIGRDLVVFLYEKGIIKTSPDVNDLLDGNFVTTRHRLKRQVYSRNNFLMSLRA